MYMRRKSGTGCRRKACVRTAADWTRILRTPFLLLKMLLVPVFR